MEGAHRTVSVFWFLVSSFSVQIYVYIVLYVRGLMCGSVLAPRPRHCVGAPASALCLGRCCCLIGWSIDLLARCARIWVGPINALRLVILPPVSLLLLRPVLLAIPSRLAVSPLLNCFASRVATPPGPPCAVFDRPFWSALLGAPTLLRLPHRSRAGLGPRVALACWPSWAASPQGIIAVLPCPASIWPFAPTHFRRLPFRLPLFVLRAGALIEQRAHVRALRCRSRSSVSPVPRAPCRRPPAAVVRAVPRHCPSLRTRPSDAPSCFWLLPSDPPPCRALLRWRT